MLTGLVSDRAVGVDAASPVSVRKTSDNSPPGSVIHRTPPSPWLRTRKRPVISKYSRSTGLSVCRIEFRSFGYIVPFTTNQPSTRNECRGCASRDVCMSVVTGSSGDVYRFRSPNLSDRQPTGGSIASCVIRNCLGKACVADCSGISAVFTSLSLFMAMVDATRSC